MKKRNWEEESPKKILSGAGFALFVLALIFILSQGAISLLVDRYAPELSHTDWYAWALTGVSIILLGLPVYLLLMKRIPDSGRGEVVKLKFTEFIVIFFITAAAMYITSMMSSVITVLIALLKGDTHLINPAQEAILHSNYALSLLYACIIAPITEEFIFRKVLLDKLKRFGDIPAILMTGIAFGLFHMNLSQFFYAAVLGFIFAYLTIRTNTVRYAILLHMMVNTISTGISPFVLKGNKLAGVFLTMWVFIAILLGIIFFSLNIKKIVFEKKEPLVAVKDYYTNAGVICYGLVCIIMIGIITIR